MAGIKQLNPFRKKKDETSVGEVLLPASTVPVSAAAYYGSHRLDKMLNGVGFVQGGDSGVSRKALIKFIRSSLRGDPASLARYADAASAVMTGNVAKDVNGRQAMYILGKLIHSKADNAAKIPLVGKRLAPSMRRLGAHLTADCMHPHFRGFPTPGQGIRTLIGEKANWGGLSLENMGYLAHKALSEHGWQANNDAAKAFDEAFRNLIHEGYNGKQIATNPKHIKPILSAILERAGVGASPEEIAKHLGPAGSDIRKSLYDAVKGTFTNGSSAQKEVANLMKTPAGMLAVQAASHTSRLGAAAHSREVLALGLLRMLRSRGFRRGAGVAGVLGTAIAGYKAYKRSKN